MTSKGLIAILASMAVALAIALPAAFGASKATVVNVTAGKPS
jgi:short-subunit dehydrogenase